MAITRTYCCASSGSISGSGFAKAKTIGSRAMRWMWRTVSAWGPETPINTSAPAIASFNEPWIKSWFVFSATHCLDAFMLTVRPRWIAPLRSQTTIWPNPWDNSSLAIAIPAAPAPLIVT